MQRKRGRSLCFTVSHVLRLPSRPSTFQIKRGDITFPVCFGGKCDLAADGTATWTPSEKARLRDDAWQHLNSPRAQDLCTAFSTAHALSPLSFPLSAPHSLSPTRPPSMPGHRRRLRQPHPRLAHPHRVQPAPVGRRGGDRVRPHRFQRGRVRRGEPRGLGVPFGGLGPWLGPMGGSGFRRWRALTLPASSSRAFLPPRAPSRPPKPPSPQATHEKESASAISAVLYPNDSTPEGKELRLKQQYFFVSASLQDVLARCAPGAGGDPSGSQGRDAAARAGGGAPLRDF